ncbi:MAG: L-threonylcarbamoyladenylate synthase [Phycisphaerales bacterium]|nr:L-threonylcarbamoyladenylate synthase [Phycisphaerales bacterium]
MARPLASIVNKPTSEAVTKAAHQLKEGGLVAFPTETVYGLGACAFNETAVANIFAIKGRPSSNPMIVHVASSREAPNIAAGWDARCEALAARFWPGPLTIVTKRDRRVPPLVTGGRDTVALRAPSHPVAQALLSAVGEPLAAPSANRSGHISATTAQHVADDFSEASLLILDGGATDVGIESTVVDVSGPIGEPINILRQGSILASDIEMVVGRVCVSHAITQNASPGTSAKHYAPCVPLRIVHADHLDEALSQTNDRMSVLVFRKNSVPSPHLEVVMPTLPAEYGKVLYEQLRLGEASDGIVVVAPPTGEQWDAIHDRLSRASD